jgi:hypothetical protein
MPEKQRIDPFDLILISDTGKFFVVKMKEVVDGDEKGHIPDRVEELQPVFQGVPEALRVQGVELADIPEHVNAGGCSCFLLNLQRMEGRGPPKDSQASPAPATPKKKPAKKPKSGGPK